MFYRIGQVFYEFTKRKHMFLYGNVSKISNQGANMTKYCVVDTIYINGNGAKLQYGDSYFDLPAELLPEIAVEGSVVEVHIQIDHSKTVVKSKRPRV